AAAHFDCAATILSGDRMREQVAMAGFPAALARSASAMCLSETGNFAAAMANADEALKMAEAIDDPFTLTFAFTGLGHHAVRMGDFAKATATLERSLTIARTRNIPVLSFLTASHLAYAHAMSGRLQRTCPWLAQLVAQASAENFEFFRTAATV